jgi:glycosyltransferase involved in cell wall biosynthesis
MKKLKLSIVVVSLNTKNRFLKTIESINRQSYKNYEIIVVDGNSSDGTSKIITNMKKNFSKVIIEEPLLQSNNVYTIATLLRFNGMISKSVFDTIGVVPEFISSYDARKYAFPELMAVRKTKRDGTPLPEKQIAKNQPVLFGDHPFDIDKKMVVFEKVCDLEPQVIWLYDKHNKLKKENFDMTDALTACRGYMLKHGLWK